MVELYGLGEAMVEIYANQALGQATNLEKSYGGDVLNALVMAQRLGAKTGFCSRIGSDPFASGLLALCQTEGVDLGQTKVVEGENGVYFISLDANGEREFTYRRAGSAASQYCPADLESGCFRGTKLLLLSGISQAISESCQAATLKAAREAKAEGVQVVFDPNYRAKLWQARGGQEAAFAAYKVLSSYIDILLPSYPNDLATLGIDATSAELALDLLRGKHRLVTLKCGADGVWVGDAKQTQAVAAQPTTACDTTGAGDAWNGAFLFCLMQNTTPVKAAHYANQVAAKKLEYRGAIPRRDTFLEELRKLHETG